MTHRGYAARIEFDARDNSIVGRPFGFRDIVRFHAGSVSDLRAAFEEAVDGHLETCVKLAKLVDKSASGRLMLRIPPEVRQAALVAAQTAGTSLNQ